MKLEQLSTNRIRVTLDVNELKENNIDLQSFLSNSKETQELFSSLLLIAQEELDFSTKNYDVSFETLYINNDFFIIVITRFNNSFSDTPFESDFCPDFFVFHSIDEFLDFYTVLKKNNFANFLLNFKYSLYLLNNKYYLHINFEKLEKYHIKALQSLLLEFSESVFSFSLDSILENAFCLIKNKSF